MSAAAYRALFADLVFSQAGQIAEVVEIGGVPHYAVPDEGFLRHVEAERIDRQIVEALQERMLGMRDLIADGVAHMLGDEAIFARPAVEQALENLDRILEPGAVDVDELRTALWMAKFRAVVDVHGDLVELDIPGLDDAGYEE